MGEPLDLDAIKARYEAAGLPGGLVHRPGAGAAFASLADVPALLARVAELETERDEARARFNQFAMAWGAMCLRVGLPAESSAGDIAAHFAAAEAGGRQWAIDALRDEDGVRDWQHANLDAYQRSFMPNVVGEFLARYLEHLAAHPDHSGG